MLRTLLIAGTLLAASGTALAHSDYGYGRVVSVEPSISVSFGTGHYDGFRVLYESGGTRYWTYSPYYPGPTIVVPPRHYYRVKHVDHHHDYGRGWDDRGWHSRKHEWREERREHRRHDDD